MTRFTETFCSQCGKGFGPGDSGYSHCDQHLPEPAVTWYDVRHSSWADESGLIFSTTDYQFAKAMAAPHGHVILIR